MKSAFLLLLGAAWLPLVAAAQSVGIGTTTPATGAALEIKASNAGLLIPRLTETQRTGITTPPQGLLVYQTDGSASGGPQTGFWYYAGSPAAWVYLDPAGGFTLAYAGSYGGPATTAFDVAHTGGGIAIRGAAPNTGVGVYGEGSTGSGVYGTASGSGGYGVRGNATGTGGAGVFGQGLSYGVVGTGGTGPGLYGLSNNGPALLVEKASGTKGRLAELTSPGSANDSTGVYVSTVGARPALRAVNANASAQPAIRGVKQAGTAGSGVEGVVTSGNNATGVLGTDRSGTSGGSGVIGQTASGYGVQGIASASGGYGLHGMATDSYAVIGESATGVALYGTTSNNGINVGAVVGRNSSLGTAAVGVLGLTSGGYGVRGAASASGGYGVGGTAIDSYGVYGTSSTGSAVYGSSTSGYGVEALSGSAAAVYGTASNSNLSTAAIVGTNTSTGTAATGVLGLAASGYGVRGLASAAGGYGVQGGATGTNSIAVVGLATGAATGVLGRATGTGRAGYFSQTNASSTANALEVSNGSLGSTAYFSQTNAGSAASVVEIAGVGTSSSLRVRNTGTTTYAAAADILSSSLYPTTTITNTGLGVTLRLNGYGIENGSGAYIGGNIYFGYQAGSVFGTITSFNTIGNNNALQLSAGAQARIRLNDLVASTLYGNWNVTGNLSKAGGSFKIDHPLDPENQYLYHSFVESPDMLNIYNGNVTLDARGEATVELPDYFEALNRDFRYQLTPIGAAFTPYVLAKVRGNQFRIAGQPGAEVSWQVTGIRHDKWANENRIPVAQAKEPANRGRYLHPAAFGQPAERGIGYRPAAGAAPASLAQGSR